MHNLGGNYWLNLIYLEELVIELNDALKPLKYQRFVSESHLKTMIFSVRDKFYDKHLKFAKFKDYVTIRASVSERSDEAGDYYAVDAIFLA